MRSRSSTRHLVQGRLVARSEVLERLYRAKCDFAEPVLVADEQDLPSFSTRWRMYKGNGWNTWTSRSTFCRVAARKDRRTGRANWFAQREGDKGYAALALNPPAITVSPS